MNNNAIRYYHARAWCTYTLAALLLAHTSTALPLGFHFKNNKTRTTIPFHIEGNLIVLEVMLNDEVNANLVLDTGARSIMLFGKKLARHLQMTDKEIRMAGYGSRADRKGRLSVNNKVSIGDIEGLGLGVIVTGKHDLFSNHNIEIHGIIGYQIFSRFVVQIDYASQTLTIIEPHMFIPDAGYSVLPLTVKDTKPYIPVTLATKGGRLVQQFHVDTGSSREMILFLNNQNGSLLDDAKKAWVGRGINGIINGFKTQGTSLGLATSVFKGLDTYLINREFSSREIQDAGGTLGSGFWKRFVIILDYVKQRFYFRPLGSFPQDIVAVKN